MPAESIPESERGAASVEHAALVLLMALVACAVVAVVAVGPDRPGRLARRGDRLQAALRGPLSRSLLAGPAHRGLRPLARRRDPGAGAAARAAERDRTDRRSSGSTTAAAVRRPARSRGIRRLTTANRRTTAFTSVDDRRRSGGAVRIDYWIYRPTIGWERLTREIGAAEIAAYADTPLLDSANPALVPLETLLGRDDAHFSAGEEPPWRRPDREPLGTLALPGCLVGLHHADPRRPARSPPVNR